MPDSKAGKNKRKSVTQSETQNPSDVKEPSIEGMSEVDVGGFMTENSDPPDMTPEELIEKLERVDDETVSDSTSRGGGNSGSSIPNPPISDNVQSEPVVPEGVREGDEFNPQIHAVDENGNPKRTKTGKYRRKHGYGRTGPLPLPTTNNVEKFSQPPRATTLQLVSMMVDIGTVLAVKTLGDEWKLSGEERTTICDTYARFAEYKGWADSATPEIAVILVTCAVFMPRIMHPNTMGKIKARFGKGSKNAYGNNRSNKNGENNPSQNTNGTIYKERQDRDSAGPVNQQLGGEIENRPNFG